jgi:hypothetical protein
MSAYNGRLKKEQEMAFGFGRFFYKNDYVHEGMSLEQLIAHARGEGVPGSKGDRSRSVMIDLGWLNQNNALRADLKELCESRGASAYAYS